MKKEFFYVFLILVFLGSLSFVPQFALSALAPKDTVNPPSNVTIGVRSACSIDVNWNAALGTLDYYEIRATSSPSFFGGLGRLVATTTGLSYEDIDLTPNTDYRYRIRTVSGSGLSSWAYSTPDSLKTSSLTTPNVPLNVSAMGQDSGKMVRLAWSIGQFSQYGRYEIERAESSGTYISVIALLNGRDFFVDNNNGSYLDPGKAYKYRMRAFESDFGCSAKVYSAYTPEIIVPAMPTNLSSSYAYSPNNPSPINLSWTQNNTYGVDYFNIYRATSTNPFTKISQETSSKRSYIDTNPESNQTYQYYILACSNSGGCSAPSNIGKTVVASAPQGFGARLYYTNGTDAAVEISFKDTFIQSSADYELHRREGTGVLNASTKTPYVFLKQNGGNPDYIIEGRDSVPAGKIYTYGVRADFGGLKSDFSSQEINTKITKIFKGVAWSAYDDVGVGWMVFNSDTETLPPSIPKFSVQVDDTGLFSGVAWASLDSAKNNGWGWLSFNKADLEGCPDYSTNLCEARLMSDGSVRGWARFISPQYGTGESAFSGWVSLNSVKIDGTSRAAFSGSKEMALEYLNKKIEEAPKSYILGGIWDKVKDTGRYLAEMANIYITNAASGVTYGVTYDSQNGKLTGQAWGSDVVGWISFKEVTCKSCDSTGFGINPQGPVTAAYFEHKPFFATKDADWYVGTPSTVMSVLGSDVPGGNDTLGSISPKNTTANEQTIYSAPSETKTVRVLAKDKTNNNVSYAETNVVEPYAFSCYSGLGGNSMNLSWKARFSDPGYTSYAPHSLTLYGGVQNPPIDQLCNAETGSPGSGSCVDNSVTADIPYFYKLKAVYTAPKPFTYETSVGPCVATKNEPASDAPSRTHVYANSDQKIYINWKDNATTTKPYHFEIQRVKLTPQKSAGFGIGWVSANTISLQWMNITSSTPYRNYYERSTSSDALLRFGPGDGSMFRSSIDGSSDPNTTTPVSYTLNDSTVSESTTYYYRVQACSSINNGDISKFYTPTQDIVKGNVKKPSPVCGKYTSTTDSGTVVATTTPPKAPTNLVAQAVSESEIQLQWKNNSEKNNGFVIYQNGNPLSPELPSNNNLQTMNYTVSGLSSNTTYTFIVKAFYDVPSQYGGGRVYSFPSNSSSDTTYAIVNTAVTPQQSGEIEYDTKAICPKTCRQTYAYGTGQETISVTLKALPKSGFVFDSWSGVSCVQATCTFTITRGSGDINAGATFIKSQAGFLNRALANIFDSVSGAWKDMRVIGDTLESFWGKTKAYINSASQKAESTLARFVSQHTDVALGQSTLDEYFKKFERSVYAPVYVDENLEPDTVYAYRVRAVFQDHKSAWDNLGAIKTLRNVAGETPEKRAVCMRNSYCDFTITGFKSLFDSSLTPTEESSLEQCSSNAMCRDVGRAGQIYKEQ